jgi:hypothetical protein
MPVERSPCWVIAAHPIEFAPKSIPKMYGVFSASAPDELLCMVDSLQKSVLQLPSVYPSRESRLIPISVASRDRHNRS